MTAADVLLSVRFVVLHNPPCCSNRRPDGMSVP
jgi:hypothetical protein